MTNIQSFKGAAVDRLPSRFLKDGANGANSAISQSHRESSQMLAKLRTEAYC